MEGTQETARGAGDVPGTLKARRWAAGQSPDLSTQVRGGESGRAHDCNAGIWMGDGGKGEPTLGTPSHRPVCRPGWGPKLQKVGGVESGT